MIYAVTFSKPVSSLVMEKFGRDYKKIKIRLEAASEKSKGAQYFSEMFTQTQVFHKRFSAAEVEKFISENAGIVFKNCFIQTDSKEITYLTNKKGKITKLEKSVENHKFMSFVPSDKKQKKYIIPEGTPVPFLVLTGVMTTDGKVRAQKYDKFKQINKFLEFIDDVIDEVKTRPVRIADFGCGKSYLTFAVHYFLTEIKNIPCQIEGLDLRKDVIDSCNEISKKLGLENINFSTGNISDYHGESNPDIVITLHACDTATDFALKYAVSKNAKVILSVPCCQHEVNAQLQKRGKEIDDVFSPLLKWGIIREKFSSLVTDAIRAQWLEWQGYNVQVLEFIDMEHTPKNILIRAVNKSGVLGAEPLGEWGVEQTACGLRPGERLFPSLADKLGIEVEILR